MRGLRPALSTFIFLLLITGGGIFPPMGFYHANHNIQPLR
ncbi:hypothetical protein ACUOA5_35265, partial [Escherichia coli]